MGRGFAAHMLRSLARLIFVLSCLTVLLMAVHGDEHGRRPRFVWKSAEETMKPVLALAQDRADAGLPKIAGGDAALALPMPIPAAPRLWRARAEKPRLPLRAARLRPYAIGPPPRA
jgi:hypothetical protein